MTEKTSAFAKKIKRIYENGTYAVIKPVAHLVSDRLIENTEENARIAVAATVFAGSVAFGIKNAVYPAEAAANDLIANLNKAASIGGGIGFGGIYAVVGAAISERFISGTKPCSANFRNGFTKEREDNLNLRSFVEKRLKRLEKAGRTDLLDKLAQKEQKAYDKLQLKLAKRNNEH